MASFRSVKEGQADEVITGGDGIVRSKRGGAVADTAGCSASDSQDALPMHEIWWVRHGESAANVGQPTESSATIPLTGVGVEQALRWAEDCPHVPDLIVSSPFLRAMETAAPLRRRHPDVTFEQWPVQEFTFLDESRYRHTTTEQRRSAVEKYWSLSDPHHVDGAGAESFTQFMRRLLGVFDRLSTMESRLTIIFAHEHVMRAAAWLILTGGRAGDPAAMRSYDGWRKAWTIPNLATLPMKWSAGDDCMLLLPLRCGGSVT